MPLQLSIMANAIKDASKVFTGQSVSFVIRFITSILVARWLGAEGKGLYASLLLVPNMMISLGELGTRQSIVYYLGRKIYPLNAIVNTALAMMFVFTIPLAILCIIVFNSYYESLFPIAAQLIAILTIPITLTVKVMSGVFLGLNKVGVYSKVTWIPATIELAFSYLLIYLFNFGLFGAVVSLVLGSLFTIIYGLSIIRNDVEFNLNECSLSIAKAILTKGVLFALALFIIQLNYRVDIFLLKGMVTMDEVGKYSVGVSLAEVLWQIPSAVAVVILARTASANSDSQKHKVAQALRVSLVVMTCVALIAIMALNYLIPVIYGNSYADSVEVNRILMIGVVVFTFYKILNSRIAGQGKPQIALFLFLPCLMLKVVLNIILVPKYGINGAAWASNISYLLASVLILIAFCKTEKLSIKDVLAPNIEDYKFIKSLIKKRKL